MSPDRNKQIVRVYYEKVVSTGEVDRIEDFISPEYEEVYEGRRHPLGIEGAREHVLGVRETFPDLTLNVEQQIAEGEWVATRITMRGTQRKEWLGMAPTGKPMTINTVNLDRVVGGRIVEHGGAADLLQPLLQAGALRVT